VHFIRDAINGHIIHDEVSRARGFAVLREFVIREEEGYVHPDLGFLIPTPSGASRGIGMIRDIFHKCQVRCLP